MDIGHSPSIDAGDRLANGIRFVAVQSGVSRFIVSTQIHFPLISERNPELSDS